MDPQWDEKAVFLKAVALSGGQRAAYLDEACPDKASRDRIEALLRHHSEATEGFLVGPTVATRTAENLETIDEFRVLLRLGRGGMGVVYLAEDTVLGRRVALKVLRPGLIGSEQALARFREEARSTAALKHPGIVPVYKFAQSGDLQYLVCEWVDGPTLAAVIDDRRQSAATTSNSQDFRAWQTRSAEIVAAIADALDAAHRAKLVHRDVKPSNILLEPDGRPRLTDFGIAKHITEETHSEQTGLIGSCHYMSPEQASIAGRKIDHRSDVFSLGVVLYEMLSLRRPFDGRDIPQILRAVQEHEPTRLRKIDRRIALDLETICHKALEKDPGRRYQTAAHIAADLRCVLDGRPILAAPPSMARRAARWLARHRLAGASVAVAALSIVIGMMLLRQWQLRREAMAWLTVDSDVPGSQVLGLAVNPKTLDFDFPPKPLGKTPLRDARLEPGQYRLIVRAPDSDAAIEFNAVLFNRGAEHLTRFAAHVQGAPIPPSAPNVRHGYFPRAAAADTDDMLKIPAGDYVCGSMADSRPLVDRRTVHLHAFFIDKFEVSNADYRQFVDATGHAAPPYWKLAGDVAGLGDRPVVQVTIEDAEAYARWRGKRLPTPFEWQAAARGPEGRLYPWGDKAADAPADMPRTPPPAVTLGNPQSYFDAYLANTRPTRTLDAWESVGPLAMVNGNVRELTAIVINGSEGVAMGRCWSDPPDRITLAATINFPYGTHSFSHGFRCARSAE